ncbi:myo-inositol-1(or 4)-monophosphatase [Salibacterium salarium]|uniref:inositol monophosphatase family protein n=1 Tax=Salibacterium salarium TaxID=284579 RepID=UPI0027821D6F|nr:inositol monophosphatase family protein [Salibacterium salarium]MDQ0297670.1 myo-inositol-1(or 4)-monophosphatase [Salibacterium salarium]
MNQWKQMLEDAKEWAKEAGQKQLERAEGPMEVNSKSSAIDFVTELDVWTENFLTEKIQANYPGHVMKTEESGNYDGESDYEWVIDPIDGTVNYARGLPFYCISIGIRYQGETVIGLVYAPKLGETFEAIKGEGASLNGRQIHSSSTSQLDKAVIASGFPYDKGMTEDNNLPHVNKLLPQIGGLRRMGSAALDLCQVACGRLDGYWEIKLKDWDVEAGILILKEAGGEVLKIEEKKGLYVMAANSFLHSKIQAFIIR